MKQITVYMPDETHHSIAADAEKEGLSISKFMLKVYLERGVASAITTNIETKINRVGDTILARLSMLEERGNSGSGDALTATEFRTLNRMLIDAVTPLLKDKFSTPQAALNLIRDRIVAGTLVNK